jgi:hypothetical protein
VPQESATDGASAEELLLHLVQATEALAARLTASPVADGAEFALGPKGPRATREVSPLLPLLSAEEERDALARAYEDTFASAPAVALESARSLARLMGWIELRVLSAARQTMTWVEIAEVFDISAAAMSKRYNRLQADLRDDRPAPSAVGGQLFAERKRWLM